MTPDQTVVLARYVRALCPQQRFDEYTPDAWHDVLGAYPLDEARAAAAHCASVRPFVSPSEIIAAIRQARSDRDRDLQGPGQYAEIPDADPDDVHAYLAALRGQRTRAAAGQPLTARPIGELTAGVTREIPSADPAVATVRRSGPLGIECPRCGAPIGKGCRSTYRKRRLADPHPARIDAARAA
ncbi:zinc finger domain-containing protein [Streptomyces sioyaensis]|uniref:zinc finger domain-containing protein n=1 Tax=Streptomyces sioyaensis TaxID=67364 RepID=UPI003D71EE8F